jgi:hypothetical protein
MARMDSGHQWGLARRACRAEDRIGLDAWARVLSIRWRRTEFAQAFDPQLLHFILGLIIPINKDIDIHTNDGHPVLFPVRRRQT